MTPETKNVRVTAAKEFFKKTTRCGTFKVNISDFSEVYSE